MTVIIDQELCTDLPPLPPVRRRRARRSCSYDRRRIVQHYFGWADPERLRLANMNIGLVGWAHLFGDPNAMSYHVARIISFSDRRSELAKLLAEVRELSTLRM